MDATLVIANYTGWSRESILRFAADDLLKWLDRVAYLRKKEAEAIRAAQQKSRNK